MALVASLLDPLPSIKVTNEAWPCTRAASNAVTASTIVGLTATMPPPRSMANQSPSAIEPASLLDSRTAWVTSPQCTSSAASCMAAATRSPSPSGSKANSAAKAWGAAWVGTTWTVLVVRASNCSATAMMFLLLGSTTTSAAGARSTAASSSAVEGFMVWPPTTISLTFNERYSSARPLPAATATTATALC